MGRRRAATNDAETVSEALKRVIRESGKPLLEIAQGCGVMPSQLSRFMRGERSLTLPTLDKVCLFLGLELTHRGGA